MDMLNEMVVFAHVVDKGGFSAAARALDIKTSSVSRSVRRLETALGTRLLHRTTRSTALTEVGQQVYAECARILVTARDIHALAGSYRAQPAGVLRVSAPIVFGQEWLAPKLPSFLTMYPDIELKVTLVDRQVDLVDDGVDLAIRVARELAPGLASRKLCPVKYVLVASPAYLAQHGSPARPAELVDHCCIYLGYALFGPTWAMHRDEVRVDVTIGSRITINNSGAIVAMVENEGGIGLVPDFAARSLLEADRLKQVLPDWEFEAPYASAVHLVYTPGPHLARKMRVFIDYLVSMT